MNILDFLSKKEPVHCPEIVNNGLNLYESLFLMKPHMIEDKYSDSDMSINSLEGTLTSVYPTSIRRGGTSEITIHFDQFLDSDFKGYRLNSIVIGDDLYSRCYYIFENQPVLQRLLFDIVDTLKGDTEPFGVKYIDTPKVITEFDNSVPKEIKIIKNCESFKDKIGKDYVFTMMTYMDSYEIDGEIYSTLNLPIEIELKIIQRLKRLGKMEIRDTGRSVKASKRRYTRINYSGETYDYADLTAIAINRITGVTWNVSGDIAGGLDIENPNISPSGTMFSIINSIYNPLINMMRSNYYFSDFTNVTTSINEFSKLEGALLNSRQDLNALMTYPTDIGLSPLMARYRPYSNELDIIKEYVTMNMSLDFIYEGEEYPEVPNLSYYDSIRRSTYRSLGSIFRSRELKEGWDIVTKDTKSIFVNVKPNDFFVKAERLEGSFTADVAGDVVMKESSALLNHFNSGLIEPPKRRSLSNLSDSEAVYFHKAKNFHLVEVTVELNDIDKIVNSKLKMKLKDSVAYVDMEELTRVESELYNKPVKPDIFTEDINYITGTSLKRTRDMAIRNVKQRSVIFKFVKDDRGIRNIRPYTPKNRENLRADPDVVSMIREKFLHNREPFCMDPLTTVLNALTRIQRYDTHEYLYTLDPLNGIRGAFKFGERYNRDSIKGFGKTDIKYIEDNNTNYLRRYITDKMPISVYPLIRNKSSLLTIPNGEIVISFGEYDFNDKIYLKTNPVKYMMNPTNYNVSRRRRDWIV